LRNEARGQIELTLEEMEGLSFGSLSFALSEETHQFRGRITQVARLET
jgi:hypothetical protein